MIQYESALRADKFLVAAHGTGEEISSARDILATVGDVKVFSKPKIETPVDV
jgi:hypothetical protein